jgi:hypothetical protein
VEPAFFSAWPMSGEELHAVASECAALCHFDPDTLEDLKRAPGANEDCEAACYDCLLSYYNQRDHRLLDRIDPSLPAGPRPRPHRDSSPEADLREEHGDAPASTWLNPISRISLAPAR